MSDELLYEVLCQVRRRTCVIVDIGCAVFVSDRGPRFTGILRRASSAAWAVPAAAAGRPDRGGRR